MHFMCVGLHKSVSKEDIFKYKAMHAALCDKLLKEKSVEVRLLTAVCS